jgi:hypothetical protein
MNDTSVQADPDIAEAATQMDAQALHLDQQAAQHADKAATIKRDVRAETEELIRQAHNLADRRVAEEDAKALPEEETATRLRAQAAYWRALATAQREAAGIPEPLQAPFAQQLGAQPPAPWTDPFGVIWDLSVTYQDNAGLRWYWTREHGKCGKHPGDWPLMNRGDFGRVEVPFCETVPLKPISEIDRTGYFHPAPAEGSHFDTCEWVGGGPCNCADIAAKLPADLDTSTTTQAASVTLPDEAAQS